MQLHARSDLPSAEPFPAIVTQPPWKVTGPLALNKFLWLCWLMNEICTQAATMVPMNISRDSRLRIIPCPGHHGHCLS